MSNKNVLFSSTAGAPVYVVNLVGTSHKSAEEMILYEETDKSWLWRWAGSNNKPHRTHKATSTHTAVFHTPEEANEAIRNHILARIEQSEKALAEAFEDLSNFLEPHRTYYLPRLSNSDVLENARIKLANQERRKEERLQETGDEQ